MKNKYLIGGIALAMIAPALVSCSSSYLDEAPLTSVTIANVTETEEGARAAVGGLARQMQRQFNNLKNGNWNISGETYIMHIYADGLGPDDNVVEATSYMRSATAPAQLRNTDGWWPFIMYDYCYSIIGEANSILHGFSNPDNELDDLPKWIVASSLTMRAHAYFRLMQSFGPRWSDSAGGTDYCLVIRTQDDIGASNDKPFSTVNEVFDLIYSDLDRAISLFESTSVERSDEELFYVNEDVARGIYARAALLKEDYVTAQSMAKAARQNYPIMSAKEYMNGFTYQNDEWMWAPYQDPVGIYYWNFGNHFGCNGHYYSNTWTFSEAIQPDLYFKISPTDIRNQCFFGPNVVDYEPEIAASLGITKEDFYLAENYALNAAMGPDLSRGAKGADMLKFMQQYGAALAEKYNTPGDVGDGIYLKNTYARLFGVHYKFWGVNDGYTSCWAPYMRGAEMLLTEAEAAYMHGDTGTAVSCLNELMAQRDPEYQIPATAGEALLEEIKLQRRIELWGEGFNWFDFKRWNYPIEYKFYDAENFEESGNYPETVANVYPADYMHGWRIAIPREEFTYNKLASPADVGQ